MVEYTPVFTVHGTSTKIDMVYLVMYGLSCNKMVYHVIKYNFMRI